MNIVSKSDISFDKIYYNLPYNSREPIRYTEGGIPHLSILYNSF